MRILAILPILLFSIFGCDLYNQNSSYHEYYVIESYLIANDSLPQVRLSTTSEIDQEYQFSSNALSVADIKIHLLNADSSIADTYLYQLQKPGIYQPLDSAIVRDKHLYQLHVTMPNGDEISSITYVPGSFKTIKKPKGSYIYQGDEQVELTVTPSSYFNKRSTYYIFTVNAVNPQPNNLTPFYLDLIESQENAIQSYYINSSSIINEEKYKRDAEGNIKLMLPWLTVVFYGENEVTVNAIDDNMYNFLQSLEVQSGGIALAPGEIQNIHYNVKGGIGIFGSMASDTNRVVIIRPEE